jgi:hypothetical protein
VGPLSAPGSTAPRTRRRRADDRGLVLVGALTKLTLTVAIVGTVGYDAISITTTQLQVQDHAQQAAVMGHDALIAKKSSKAAYAAVVKYAKENGETVEAFKVTKDRVVIVTFTREARTIAASHVPKVKSYIVATGTGTASDPVR